MKYTGEISKNEIPGVENGEEGDWTGLGEVGWTGYHGYWPGPVPLVTVNLDDVPGNTRGEELKYTVVHGRTHEPELI